MASMRQIAAKTLRPWLTRSTHRAFSSSNKHKLDELLEVAVIAFGTNVGDRVGHIRKGLSKLASAGIKITRHSCLYESAPAYVTEQPAFLNGAVAVRTSLPPDQLLHAVKQIEKECGRADGGIRNGPRTLDLDLIFYGGAEVSAVTDTGLPLKIPHQRYAERSFVLAPLCDLLDDPDNAPVSLWRGGGAAGAGIQGRLAEAKEHWDELGGEAAFLEGGGGEEIRRVLPLGDRLVSFGARTHVMGILNVTPDSFSDGGKYTSTTAAVEQACRMVEEGATFIDIGGQSTRPGADLLPPRTELDRVLPVLEALAKEPAIVGAGTVLSVDTFYGEVAREAVAAGSHLVNDVSGGGMDASMLPTMGKMGKHAGYCLMHMRGDPRTMQNPENTAYTNVCDDVGDELWLAGEQAAAAGIEPWRLILDPGIGFAKTNEGNMELLAGLGQMRRRLRGGALRRAPLLVGPSRKGFLGTLTGRDKERRDVATAAAAVVAVQAGADIIRAHNVSAVMDAVQVADAAYRRAAPSL